MCKMSVFIQKAEPTAPHIIKLTSSKSANIMRSSPQHQVKHGTRGSYSNIVAPSSFISIGGSCRPQRGRIHYSTSSYARDSVEVLILTGHLVIECVSLYLSYKLWMTTIRQVGSRSLSLDCPGKTQLRFLAFS